MFSAHSDLLCIIMNFVCYDGTDAVFDYVSVLSCNEAQMKRTQLFIVLFDSVADYKPVSFV